MALDNSIDHLEDDLKLAYEEAKANWKRDHPAGPWPELNETLRNEAVQTAYYARTRKPVKEVQRLYKAAGLYEIDAKEAAAWATNAQYGQSAHNARKGSNKARAFDVRFRVLKEVPTLAGSPKCYIPGPKIDWEGPWYTMFGGYMLAAASKLLAAGKIKRRIVWGNDWNGNGLRDEKSVDPPHYELKGWADMK
jgi:hypothetical protein